MIYNNLGNTGLKVSKLCFGSLTLGPLQNNLSVPQADAVLCEAFNMGINFVDTAQLYKTYELIAPALKKYPDTVVASKTYAYTKRAAIDAVEEARKKLDRDYIDVFLLHEQESEHTLRGHAEALDELYNYKSKGIIKAVGLSTHNVNGVHAAIKAGLDVVHPLLNIQGLGILGGVRADMENAITAAQVQGIGVYTMKALGGGNLFAKAEDALKYALNWGDSLAIGMKTAEEVHANVNFLYSFSFSEKEKEYIFSRKRLLIIEEHCSGCGKCTEVCNSNALSVENNQAVCNAEKCLLCGYCSAQCEDFCIKII